MNKKIWWVIIGLVVIIVLLIVLKKNGVIGKDEGTKVSTEKVTKRTITETVNASGKIYPEVEVKVSPDISGEIVELNVQEQCINVIKMACVQERYILEEYPIVHGWVFDLRTGKIIDLEIDFEKILKDIQKIYNLTSSDWVMSRKTD